MTIKEIDEALEEGNSLKVIAQSYTEIANLKIKRIRTEVERNRVFFQEISKVFALVKKLAIRKGVSIRKSKKRVALIITSNYRFYGSINADLIDFYVQNCKEIDIDKILIGRAAIDYFKTSPLPGNTTEILLKQDQPNTEELIKLVEQISEYNQVLVVYSSMKSLLIQQPLITDITASSESSTAQSDKKEDDIKFIFEPELAKVLNFFDSQIITLLLEGTFLESELSRTASRFISMDTAETEANKFIKEYEKLKAYVKRNRDNNKILENFASIAALRRGEV